MKIRKRRKTKFGKSPRQVAAQKEDFACVQLKGMITNLIRIENEFPQLQDEFPEATRIISQGITFIRHRQRERIKKEK